MNPEPFLSELARSFLMDEYFALPSANVAHLLPTESTAAMLEAFLATLSFIVTRPAFACERFIYYVILLYVYCFSHIHRFTQVIISRSIWCYRVRRWRGDAKGDGVAAQSRRALTQSAVGRAAREDRTAARVAARRVRRRELRRGRGPATERQWIRESPEALRIHSQANRRISRATIRGRPICSFTGLIRSQKCVLPYGLLYSSYNRPTTHRYDVNTFLHLSARGQWAYYCIRVNFIVFDFKLLSTIFFYLIISSEERLLFFIKLMRITFNYLLNNYKFDEYNLSLKYLS